MDGVDLFSRVILYNLLQKLRIECGDTLCSKISESFEAIDFSRPTLTEEKQPDQAPCHNMYFKNSPNLIRSTNFVTLNLPEYSPQKAGIKAPVRPRDEDHLFRAGNEHFEVGGHLFNRKSAVF